MRQRIDAFIAAYNQNAQLFVRARHPRTKYADLCKEVLAGVSGARVRCISSYILSLHHDGRLVDHGGTVTGQPGPAPAAIALDGGSKAPAGDPEASVWGNG